MCWVSNAVRPRTSGRKHRSAMFATCKVPSYAKTSRSVHAMKCTQGEVLEFDPNRSRLAPPPGCGKFHTRYGGAAIPKGFNHSAQGWHAAGLPWDVDQQIHQR